MLINVHHETRYTYDQVIAHTIQRLALTPQNLPGQSIKDWNIDAPGIEAAPSYRDAFGNMIRLCTQTNMQGEMLIVASGTVETTDKDGVVGRVPGDPPARLFLRQTPVTKPSQPMMDLATELAAAESGEVNIAHRLMSELHSRLKYDVNSTNTGTTAAESFDAAHGVCQDFTHILIGMARHLDIPARYVTGYLLLADEVRAEAQHAWAEVWVKNLGWVGFDPANNVCPTERYIRLCSGLDAVSAAPIKGLRIGQANESLSVMVDVQQANQ